MLFEPFHKLPRLARHCIITEKIDGTNAQVAIEDSRIAGSDVNAVGFVDIGGVCHTVYAGSRTRWLQHDGGRNADNFGFAVWVHENLKELAKLGPGRHYGEWWGQGIQRNYGMKERCFSLFNADRWQSDRPDCCLCVPVLYRGPFTTEATDQALDALRDHGSLAAPGFDKPEGIVVYHRASNSMFKRTCEKDEEPKRKERDQDGNAAP